MHAYLGQAVKIRTPQILTAAATIVTIEARHATAVALFLTDGKQVKGKLGITPDGPFDVPLSKNKVLAAVKKTGFIVG